MIKDYYLVLRVNQNATKNEIKKAYRSLALELHPDKNNHHNAHQMFIELNEAYLILSDDDARRKYDKEYHFWQDRRKDESSNNETKKEFIIFEDEDLRKWANTAREQGEEYAKMSFSNFAEMLKNIAVYVAVYGSKAFAHAFTGVFGVSAFFSTIGGIAMGNFPLILGGIISGVLAYYLSNYSNND